MLGEERTLEAESCSADLQSCCVQSNSIHSERHRFGPTLFIFKSLIDVGLDTYRKGSIVPVTVAPKLCLSVCLFV